MRDQYKIRYYKCTCGLPKVDYCWDSKLKTHKTKCGHCKKTLTYKNIWVEDKPQLTSIRTETKNR